MKRMMVHALQTISRGNPADLDFGSLSTTQVMFDLGHWIHCILEFEIKLQKMQIRCECVSNGHMGDVGLMLWCLLGKIPKIPQKWAQFLKAPPGGYGSKSTTEQVTECRHNLRSITAITGKLELSMIFVLIHSNRDEIDNKSQFHWLW